MSILLTFCSFQQIGEKGVNISGGQRQRVSFNFLIIHYTNLAGRRSIWPGLSIMMLISSFWTTRYLLVKLTSNLIYWSLLTKSFKVDAHVGKSLFHDALLGALRNQGKTVIFVTHALHFLSYCDYIYTLRDGYLTEQGTFQELIAANGEFARLDKEYGGNDSQPTEKPQATTAVTGDFNKSKSRSSYKRAGGTGKLEGKLIVKEQRTTGSIPLQSNSLCF